MNPNESHLLSGRLLASSAVWSLAAQALPAIVGVVTIPFIVRGLGVERFGVLTLAWMVIGYFSLFDLGLGRAVTKMAAEFLASTKPTNVEGLIWTAWYLMFGLGIGGTVALSILTPWLVTTAVKIPVALQRESLQAFYLLAGAIPIVVLTAGFRGVLEAAQRFRLTSLVKIPMGILTFVAPLLVLRFTPNIAVIVLTLIAVRLLGAIAYALMCHRAVRVQGTPTPFDRTAARTLLRQGAWMTVSNVISPLMMSVDRFFVGAIVSVAAVAYYATPFEAVTKLLIIPSAIAAVFFPAFSTASVIDRERMMDLFRTGLWFLFLSMYPLVFITVAFAPELLRLWLGTAFARQSAGALQWLALGVLMNSLASMPFALLQGMGRSDTTAKIHLVEAPAYLVLMVWLIHRYGITGAAAAWSARTTLDLGLLYWQAAQPLTTATGGSLRDIAIFALLTPALVVGVFLRTPLQKVLVSSMLLFSFAVLAWAVAGVRRPRIPGVPEELR